jgi:hypothetical protein
MKKVSLVPILASAAVLSCGGSTASSQGQGRDSGPDTPITDAATKDGRTPEDAASPTDGETVLPSLDAGCLGMADLTGQALLDALRPEYTATYTPAGGGAPTALTIRTQYNHGPASCHPSACDECPPGWVQVEVQIDFATADGLFDETFTTPVELSPGGDTLSWDPVVPASDIKGTYKPTLVGHPTVNLSFGGTFSAASTSGVVEQQASNGGGGSVAPAGTWK